MLFQQPDADTHPTSSYTGLFLSWMINQERFLSGANCATTQDSKRYERNITQTNLNVYSKASEKVKTAPIKNVLQAPTPYFSSNARTSQLNYKIKSPSARLCVKSTYKNWTPIAHGSQLLSATFCTLVTWTPLRDHSSLSSSSLTVCCRDSMPNLRVLT